MSRPTHWCPLIIEFWDNESSTSSDNPPVCVQQTKMSEVSKSTRPKVKKSLKQRTSHFFDKLVGKAKGNMRESKTEKKTNTKLIPLPPVTASKYSTNIPQEIMQFLNFTCDLSYLDRVLNRTFNEDMLKNIIFKSSQKKLKSTSNPGKAIQDSGSKDTHRKRKKSLKKEKKISTQFNFISEESNDKSNSPPKLKVDKKKIVIMENILITNGTKSQSKTGIRAGPDEKIADDKLDNIENDDGLMASHTVPPRNRSERLYDELVKNGQEKSREQKSGQNKSREKVRSDEEKIEIPKTTTSTKKNNLQTTKPENNVKNGDGPKHPSFSPGPSTSSKSIANEGIFPQSDEEESIPNVYEKSVCFKDKEKQLGSIKIYPFAKKPSCRRKYQPLYLELMSGDGNIVLDNKSYRMRCDLIYTINPGTLYSIENRGHSLLVLGWKNFDCSEYIYIGN